MLLQMSLLQSEAIVYVWTLLLCIHSLLSLSHPIFNLRGRKSTLPPAHSLQTVHSSRDPGTPTKSPRWVAETQSLGPSLRPRVRISRGLKQELEQGMEPPHYDVGYGHLSCCTPHISLHAPRQPKVFTQCAHPSFEILIYKTRSITTMHALSAIVF